MTHDAAPVARPGDGIMQLSGRRYRWPMGIAGGGAAGAVRPVRRRIRPLAAGGRLTGGSTPTAVVGELCAPLLCLPGASMCGRYSLTSDLDRLLPRLQGPLPPGLLEHYAPRSQVRPGEPVLLQRWEHGGPQVGLALWGLLPGWVKDPLAAAPDGRRRSRPINARSETVADKPFFRGAWRHRRALLPADGFYEWQDRTDPATGRSWKQPWLFRRRDRAPFWLGGLWERWVGADGGELETAVILTTSPNELMARVHDRMPVVIPDGLEQAWLEPDDGPSLRALQPLMGPWEPHEWEALKLELPPPTGAEQGDVGVRSSRPLQPRATQLPLLLGRLDADPAQAGASAAHGEGPEDPAPGLTAAR